jgi:F0F1-type ATP synthase gamma subunit
MVACGNYMHKFSVSKDMKKKINNGKRRKEVAVGKVATQFMSNNNYQRIEK